MWLFAHLLDLAHGSAAALTSIGGFYLAGLLLRPRRAQSSATWANSVVFGLMFYVLLCWAATSSRNIPVLYIAYIFGVAVAGLAALRFRTVRATLGPAIKNRAACRWVAGFILLYLFAYLLVRPPAGAEILVLPADGAIDLVTYARYAKQLQEFGTADVDVATFGYLHSRAGAYLLAWHSVFFRGDPLDASMPLLFMVAALFGAIAIEVARSLFRLSWRTGVTIAAIALCAPMFRWALTTYSPGALLSATSVLYLAGEFGRAAALRSINVSRALGIAAAGALLFFSAGPVRPLSGFACGVIESSRHLSPLALLGLPSGIPSSAAAPDSLRAAALVVLPLVPLIWGAAVWAVRRSTAALDRVGTSVVDRRLLNALVVYIAAGVVVGNVAVQAVRGRAAVHWPGAWRGLSQIGRMPFNALTLKVADQPYGLSTALAMYYMPGKKAHVIGRGVSLDDLPYEYVSRQQPMFIQSFGCEGVGHGDTVSIPRVGCLLLAPPSMTVETSYPFNRTFLFLDFDRMTSREPGGRWNTQSTLNLRVMSDPQRAGLDRELYLNFLVNPFVPPDATMPRLELQWGKKRGGVVLAGGRQWFSLPLGSSDWSGNRVWTIPVTIEFPEGRTILFHEVALTESARGTVAENLAASP
jgi:hypothetical protein